ncbi:hypothetical protein J577_0078 [Acinetobacter sp. 263903-1]|nr:hypothetical protein J546_0289 [Acinetobacter sp. 1461402]EXB73581.1 hypothetical protein J550_0849 [Acinetobacter sp. 230853]KCX39352.1 hypothetical protein J577_0078 [Acinetobacter sp. 263903-1]
MILYLYNIGFFVKQSQRFLALLNFSQLYTYLALLFTHN